MSSILHNQLNPSGSRVRRALATAVVGLGLASTGYAVASAVPQASGAAGHTASASVPAPQVPGAEGRRAPASIALYNGGMRKIRWYETKGYVPTACTIRGTLLVNPHTHRSVTIEP